MKWQPNATQAVLALRARMLHDARHFFETRGVMEVETPLMLSAAGADPCVPAFTVTSHDNPALRFLHTSPEHAMKRLLCAGSGDIFQIAPVFRDGESGVRHNPEFTMIEWYRLGFDHHEMAAETVTAIRLLLGPVAEQLKVHRHTYRDIFVSCAEVDPVTVTEAQLLDHCERHGVGLADSGRFDRRELLDLLFGAVVAPQLTGAIVVIYDYPADQAALARVRAGAPPVAERFEVFVDGMELANGFHELADEVEQRRRFEHERELCRRAGRTVAPLDENLLAALASQPGLPDCAGVALGFDRLVMLASGAKTIADVMAFSYERS